MPAAKIQALAREKLEDNLTAGAALTFVVLLSYLCIGLVGEMIAAFFVTALLDFSIAEFITMDGLISAAVTLLIVLTVLAPLRLNMKSWYQHLEGEYLPLTLAFSYFTGIKKYRNALWFCSVRLVVVFLTFLIPMLPAVVLGGVLRFGFHRTDIPLGADYATLLVVTGVLVLLALAFSVYYAAGFFYADYLFVTDVSHNPFKLLRLSRKIARQGKAGILLTIAAQTPYYLLCLLIVPIPFVVPKIKASFAVFAEQMIGAYMLPSQETAYEE